MEKKETNKKGTKTTKRGLNASIDSGLSHNTMQASQGLLAEEEEKPKYTNEKWSQLIAIGRTNASEISLVRLADALEENLMDPLPARKSKRKPWAIVFDPE